MKLKMGFALALAALGGLQACASQSVMLVHPQSGATVKCEEEGVGFLAAAVGPRVQECLKTYEARGYVQIEKLRPDQRADLERRGLLPEAEKPPARMGY